MKLINWKAVIVDGETYKLCNIGSIKTGNGYLYMNVWNGFEGGRDIVCRLEDAEFVDSSTMPRMPELPKPSRASWEGFYMCGDRGFFGPPFGSSADDIEIVSPLETMKQAFVEAIKEMGNTPKTIQVGLNINGEQFAKAIKPGDSIRDSRSETMIAAFDKVGAATKELNERFNTLRNSIEALNRVATEALKKYDNTGGD